MKFELFPKEWTTTYNGCSIRVRNSWTGGIQLYVNDNCCASNTELFAIDKTKPVIRHEFTAFSGAPFVIEVFAYALLTVKVRIVINGTQVAGDSFY
jgi:hypothetical protein